MNSHLDALAILSRAKVAALDAIHDRNVAFGEYVHKDGPKPGRSLFELLETWRLVANAYDHVVEQTFQW